MPRSFIVAATAAATLVIAGSGPLLQTPSAFQGAAPRGESAQKTPERRPPATPRGGDHAQPRAPEGAPRAVPREGERSDARRPLGPQVWPPFFYGVPYVPWYFPYGYPPYEYYYPYAAYGGVRLDVDHQEASVLVDGFYVGIVDDFDGPFQWLTLKAGRHRLEICAAGYQTLAADLNIVMGRTITFHGRMIPIPIEPSAPFVP
jgi:hypothetical protein